MPESDNENYRHQNSSTKWIVVMIMLFVSTFFIRGIEANRGKK